jgi:hypothetical protein
MHRALTPSSTSRHYALCAAIILCGCGAEEDGVPEGGGEVRAPWDAHCIATFSERYEFVDPFGDPEFVANAGSRYLLGGFGTFGAEASVLYLGRNGPIELSVDVESGAALPFSSNCEPTAVEEHVGVFAETTVYSDEAMSMPVCVLTEGATFPGGSLSYALVSGDLFRSGGTYEVSFDGLSAACGGLVTGYVEATTVKLGGGSYTGLALASVIGPSR